MSAHTYRDLRVHIGHKIACVCYGCKGEDPENIAIECETCNEVLLDFNRPEELSTVEALYRLCPYHQASLTWDGCSDNFKGCQVNEAREYVANPNKKHNGIKKETSGEQSMQEMHGGLWGEHPVYPITDWRNEVSNDDTRLGYWDWVAHQLEGDTSNHE